MCWVLFLWDINNFILFILCGLNGNHCSLDLKTVKKEIIAYLAHNRQNFEWKKFFLLYMIMIQILNLQ